MKNLIKRILAATMAATMIIGGSMTALAGQWKQQVTGYHQMGYVYENSDGTYAKDGWHWIDGKCYYFNENGIMLSNTTTPDGYTVDGSGAWTVNGQVQTQAVNNPAQIPYDSAHPLANVVDKWNLRVPSSSSINVCSPNVQVMLTNQMDQYYAAPIGESIDKYGDRVYVTEEDYNSARNIETSLYNWFCDWLNGMDFQNMSETQRAQEIANVLANATYDYDYTQDYHRNGDYSILIDKKGICGEFTMTASSLAKALGLESIITGYGNHAYYFIKADGYWYEGDNAYLKMNMPLTEDECRARR